jgi:hypothetical protein
MRYLPGFLRELQSTGGEAAGTAVRLAAGDASLTPTHGPAKQNEELVTLSFLK